jgi:hypothetical protein
MLDFSIFSVSSKSMLFIDESEYKKSPSNPLLQIKFPSICKDYEFIVRPKECNSFNTVSLGYTEKLIDFPDGKYEATYSIEPNEYLTKTKSFMHFGKTKEKIKELLKEDLDKATIDKLYKLDLKIQASESLVEDSPDKAMEYFDMVQKEIKTLDC